MVQVISVRKTIRIFMLGGVPKSLSFKLHAFIYLLVSHTESVKFVKHNSFLRCTKLFTHNIRFTLFLEVWGCQYSALLLFKVMYFAISKVVLVVLGGPSIPTIKSSSMPQSLLVLLVIYYFVGRKDLLMG